MEHLKCDQLGYAGPINIRLGWKGRPETKTLAYYEHLYIKDMKSFITLGLTMKKMIETSTEN